MTDRTAALEEATTLVEREYADIYGKRCSTANARRLASAALSALPLADTEGEGGWRHKKRGTIYDIIGSATVQASLPPPLHDGAEVLIYRCREDGSLYVRRPTEFHDGRFEKIVPSRGEPT